MLSFDDFEPHLHHNNDTLYLVNFWATWCTPCVDEIPHFEQIGKEYGENKVKVLLVSLDFPNHIDSRLIPFIEKHNLNSEVVVLNDPDANSWIEKVDPKWSGAIPATLIYSSNTRDFHEGAFTYDELKTKVEQKLTSR
jgi:thiol-disulfide isomerase/thioredoxin